MEAPIVSENARIQTVDQKLIGPRSDMPSNELKSSQGSSPLQLLAISWLREHCASARRIDVDFHEPGSDQDSDNGSVPLVQRQVPSDEKEGDERADLEEQLWLMAGRTRYRPDTGVSVRVQPVSL